MTTTAINAGVHRIETVRSFAEQFALGQHTLPELLAAVYDTARDAGTVEGIAQASTFYAVPDAVVVPDHSAFDGRPLVLVDFDDPFAAAVDSDALDRVVIQTSRPVSDDEIDHLWHLMAYTYRSTVRGRSVGRPERIDATRFQVSINLTGSPRTSVHDAMWEFVTGYSDVVASGSPLRMTNRAGAGTAGTRAVDAFSDPSLHVQVLVPRFTGYVGPDTPAPQMAGAGI